MLKEKIKDLSNKTSRRISLQAFYTILLFVFAIFFILLPELEESLHARKKEMIMHPYRGDLEGKNMAEFQDSNGTFLFFEFVKMVQQQGAGYVDYLWQWKDDPMKISPKMSYIKGFDPWGLIIGTGMYIDDVHAEISEIRKKLTAISMTILLVVSLLFIYSIRQTMIADRERLGIFMEREILVKSLEESFI